MKKVWKCSLCTQICSRRENLKRHCERLHNGQGKPLLRYISGNSILTPEETLSSPPLVIFSDEYAQERPGTAPPLQSNAPQIQSGSIWQDKLLQPFLKVMQFQSMINYANQSRLQNQPVYFPHYYAPAYNSFRSSYPMYYVPETTSNKQDNNPGNYDGVSGFKVDICLNCLATFTMPVGSKDLNLQEIHKCTPGAEDAIIRLGPDQYALDLERQFNQFPELLFNKCKGWANSASGRIYLIARKIESSNKSDTQYDITLVDYEALPFIRKVVEQSKITLNDRELYEFLKLAKNQTKTVITLRGKPDQMNLRYILAVSIV